MTTANGTEATAYLPGLPGLLGNTLASDTKWHKIKKQMTREGEKKEKREKAQKEKTAKRKWK